MMWLCPIGLSGEARAGDRAGVAAIVVRVPLNVAFLWAISPLTWRKSNSMTFLCQSMYAVERVMLPRDKHSHRPKGYSFLILTSHEEQQRLVHELTDRRTVHGRPVTLKVSMEFPSPADVSTDEASGHHVETAEQDSAQHPGSASGLEGAVAGLAIDR